MLWIGWEGPSPVIYHGQHLLALGKDLHVPRFISGPLHETSVAVTCILRVGLGLAELLKIRAKEQLELIKVRLRSEEHSQIQGIGGSPLVDGGKVERTIGGASPVELGCSVVQKVARARPLPGAKAITPLRRQKPIRNKQPVVAVNGDIGFDKSDWLQGLSAPVLLQAPLYHAS